MALIKLNNRSSEDTAIHGRRNLIINGAMEIAQRGTSSTGTGYQTVDRFAANQANYDELSATKTQDSSAPDGFKQSFKVLVSTEETIVAADEYANISYAIEGQDLQRLAYGTSSAKSFTLSFYVKSNLTGNFSVTAYKQTGSNKQQDRRYTINTADTWERKTLTFVGDTAQLVADDVNAGMYLYWHLGFGSNFGTDTYDASAGWSAYTDAGWGAGQDVELLDTQNNYIQITGVQMEVGDLATPFEHRTQGEYERECERYYQIVDVYFSTGSYSWAYHYFEPFEFRTIMRAAPTIEKHSKTDNTGSARTIDGANASHNGLVLVQASQYVANCRGGSTNSFGFMDARCHFKSEI